MSGLRRPKATRGSAAQATSANAPARQSLFARNLIFEATRDSQLAAAGVSAPLFHGLPPGSRDSMYPPGGFTNFLQHNSFLNNQGASQLPENSHFVGATSTEHAVSPTENISMDANVVGLVEKEPIDIDGDETPQAIRSEIRLNWTRKEDERLASAWLLNSIDPVDGNNKKLDRYWGDVTTTYNSTTASNRTRNRNQLKIR
uniref:Myb-like domain-containing protein n=1 Tax=Oryza brachyantha TaxID=4533 RepID=J3LC57_ORYBR